MLSSSDQPAAPKATILVVDDDPDHLRIYGWIMKSAGFLPVPALAQSDGVSLPENGRFDVIVMDYRLTGSLTAVEAARQIRKSYPDPPIIVLSDMFGMPEDIAPYARRFVRKGEPEKLIATIQTLLEETRPARDPDA